MSEKWEAEATSAYFSNNGEVIVEYRVKHPIKEISKPRAVANTQLIAAAPELLERLEKAIKRIESMNDLITNTLGAPVGEIPTDDLKKIVKKAKGDDK